MTITIYAGDTADGTPVQTSPSVTVNEDGSYSWTLTTALDAGFYTIQAQQADDAGNIGSSTTQTILLVLDPPAAPTGVAAEFVDSSFAQVTWDAANAADAVGVYSVYMAQDGGDFALVGQTTDTAYTITGLDAPQVSFDETLPSGDTVIDINGTNEFIDYVAVYSDSFNKSYTVDAMNDWTVTFKFTKVNGIWTNNGSSVTKEDIDEPLVPESTTTIAVKTTGPTFAQEVHTVSN